MSMDDINSIKMGVLKSRNSNILSKHDSKRSPFNRKSKGHLYLDTIKDDINERLAQEISLMSRSSKSKVSL